MSDRFALSDPYSSSGI